MTSPENQEFDKKSIRYTLGKHADLDGLACHCVGLANSIGGKILVGIEDDNDEPDLGQRIPPDLPEKIRKRIPQITVNVSIIAELRTASNGGEYLEIRVQGNQHGIASTSDGRYFLRVADETRRLLPDDLNRLLTERSSQFWELQTANRVPASRLDTEKANNLLAKIRSSDRVSDFVRNKSDQELFEHYFLTRDQFLTNLGVLWIGKREDRAGLQYAPAVQCIKYDSQEKKIRKLQWSEYDLNPLEMIESVWREVPDWLESYELPDGLFRKTVPHYDEEIVRELLANALVHRPYNQQGDIFINLYSDRMEVHNPGLLPIGVTPQNILHVSVMRNPHLAKLFYDLRLMEREGSGFDRMYEIMLRSGRPAPRIHEADDRVVVTIQKRIVKTEIVDFMFKVDQEFQPTQKELITLGTISLHETITTANLKKSLELMPGADIKDWIGRLRVWRLISTRGKTNSTEFLIEPSVLKKLQFKGKTSLRGIERHRLSELILRDIEIYGPTSRSEIHQRIGSEIPLSKVRRTISELLQIEMIEPSGGRKQRKYLLRKKP